MQMILAVVLGKGIFNSFQREFTTGYTVSVTPDECTEVWVILDVFLQGLISQYYISRFPIPIRHQ